MMQIKQSFKASNNIHLRSAMANNSPKKNQMLMGVTFTKKASNKTLNTSNTKVNNAFHYRGSISSIQQLHHSNSVENVQIQREIFTKPKESDEMFGRSYAKIQKMKGTILNTEIDNELNDILVLIKEEKFKIQERMKYLQRNNNYFKRICQGGKTDRANTGINTEELINDGLEAQYVDRAIQCDQIQNKSLQQNAQSQQKIKKRKQAYGKLHTMLIEMNIDPTNILPEDSIQQAKQTANRQFKVLSDTEIIKIQKFFIKKLAVKIQK